ncbi:MAG: hypothetical protein Ct9H300mP11_27690 [Chloroflexota bacterium]|nr:MAG: hypothetical protein Ct9H300mP11_27690 [Chloroflexota bacterium]
MKEKVLEEVKRFFRPEFLNRIDSTVVFHQLTKPEILQIVDLMMNQVRDELGEKDIDMEVTDAAKSHLGEKGFDPVLGARPLRRLIQDEMKTDFRRSLESKNRCRRYAVIDWIVKGVYKNHFQKSQSQAKIKGQGEPEARQLPRD